MLKQGSIGNIEKSQYYHDIASKFYRRDDLDAAINSLAHAITLRQQLKTDHPELLKKSLYNLGFFYKKNGETLKSIAAYKEILWDKVEDDYRFKSYRELGVIYIEIGDFNKALEHFERAERYFEKHQDSRNLFLTHLWISYCYTQMDRLLYLEELRFHLDKCDSINDANNKTIMRDDEALSLNLRKGNLYVELGKDFLAKKALQSALTVAEKINHPQKARIYNSLGKLYLDGKELDKAARSFGNAQLLSNDNVTSALIANNMGDYYKAKKHWSKAEKEYLESIELLIGKNSNKLPSPSQLVLVPNKLDVLDYLKDISNFYMEMGAKHDSNVDYLGKALESLKLADSVVDMLRQESTEYLSKLFWRSQSSEIYMKGVEVSFLLKNKEMALYFMEKDKVLLLLEDLTKEQALDVSEIPDSLRFKTLNLRRKISSLQEKLLTYKPTEKDSIRNMIFSSKKDLEQLETGLETMYPGYASLKRDIPITNTRETKKLIANNSTVVVEFIMNSEKGYVYFQSTQGIHLEEVVDIARLNEEVDTLLAMISNPFTNETDFQEFNRLSNSIYTQLFGKIETKINEAKTLIIVPDGILSKIPFELLQPEISKNPSNPLYLLFSKDIHYGLSLSHLEQNKKVQRKPEDGFLGVAPILYQEKGLPELTNTNKELKGIQNIMGGMVLKKGKANKENVLSQISSRNIVHLATHADFDNDQNTWLWFYDEKLHHTELYLTKTQADLVVLSACKTMQGEWVEGEGLMSLTRGFLKTGAHSVLSSLWNANDKSSREIMIDFYKNLKQGQSKAMALKNAKITYLKTHSGVANSPYYWASNVITGNGGILFELEGSSNLPQALLFILIGTFILIAFLLLRGKRVSFFG